MFGSGYPTHPSLKRAKSPTQYIFESSGKKLKSWGFMKWLCKKLVAMFSKRRHVMQARRAWIPPWIPETHNSNLSERSKWSFSFIKTCLVFFSVKSDSLICRSHNYYSSDWHVTWEAGANGEWPLSWHHYCDILIMTSLSFCLHQDGVFSKLSAKIYMTSASIYTFFGLILTCIRNDIVLHVYFNPKCNENWRKAAYHASSDSIQCVVSGVCVCVCVWCQASEFCTGHLTR